MLLNTLRQILILTLFLSQPVFAAVNDSEVHYIWLNIEVVTNDFNTINRIIQLTDLKIGSEIALSDPRLKQACKNIRENFTNNSVNCRAIIQGNREAIYVVEIDKAGRENHRLENCSEQYKLRDDLLELAQNRNALSIQKLTSPDSPVAGEFVNANHYLDSTDSDQHRMAIDIHEKIRGEFEAIKTATLSCDSEMRVSAIELLNLIGSPHQAIELATRSINDPEVDVRNSAIRLLGVFSGYIQETATKNVVTAVCEVLKNPTFFDRNKSLALISVLAKAKRIRYEEIPSACFSIIESSAKYNFSDQIHGFATQILENIGKIPSK
jgi:hypothetical protein